jgi:hypothetical protein
MSSSSSSPHDYNAATTAAVEGGLPPQSFSPILPSSSSSSTRRVVGGTVESLNLCPSMDLCVYHTSKNHPSSRSSAAAAAGVDIPLYRTISWQKVATIRQDHNDDNDNVNNDDHKDVGSDDPPHGHEPPTTTTTCCWSPSGRWIAVAMGHKVHLYGVELLANPPEGFTGGGGGATATTTVQHSLERRRGQGQGGSSSSSIVQGLYWAHVGRAHPTAWKMSQEEVEDALSWT